ncbi:hypothetical protein DL93DRAFT_2229090 [Clavulina sp. PMI_390]|nr:hypothetical protein DL93DRAFT_2229090 [Clavulina sp. PMI_390]
MHLSLLALSLGLLAPLAAVAAPTAPQALTPFGHLSTTQVHEVPEGASVHHVGDEVHIVNPEGAILHKATPNGNFTRATPSPAAGGLQNGWIAYAYWLSNSIWPINYFDTTWTVPPLPQRPNDGQTLFLFNALEPAVNGHWGGAILQPVLQYGVSAAGGGPYWSIANWYGSNGVYWHTPLIKVAPGRVLTGVMTLTGTTANGWNYNSFFNGIGGKMIVYNSRELRWASETLEAYGLKSVLDFPKGSTTLGNLHLRTVAGYPGVTWTTVSTPVDTTSAKVLRQGSNGGSIQIIY